MGEFYVISHFSAHFMLDAGCSNAEEEIRGEISVVSHLRADFMR